MTRHELIQARSRAGAVMLAANRAYQHAVVRDSRATNGGDLPPSTERQQLYQASLEADDAYVAAHKAVIAYNESSDREIVATRLRAAIAC